MRRSRGVCTTVRRIRVEDRDSIPVQCGSQRLLRGVCGDHRVFKDDDDDGE
jgi:hypothetical protein